VTFHGVVADPRDAYDRADVLVLPSDAEGFGLVLIEAMASGVPVIGTDVDGIRDVITHMQTGLLVPARSPLDLAKAIQTLRDQPTLRMRLVNNARQKVVDHFSWAKTITRYRQLLKIRVD